MKIFSLGGGVKVDSGVLGKPFVYGVSLRPGWKALETYRNVFDWTKVDATIKSAIAKGKKVFFRVMTGPSCPTYILNDSTIPKVTFYSTKIGSMVTTPVLWNAKYLERYYVFCQSLSTYLAKIPGVEMVAISGAADGAANPFLEKDGMSEYIKAGYTAKLWTDTWKTMIDKHLTYFPTKTLSLCFDCEDHQIAQDLTAYAYQKALAGKKIVIQSNGLHGRPGFLETPKISFLYNYINKMPIGFQMTWSSGDRLGPMDQAIKNAQVFKADFLEVYQEDIIDPKYAVLFANV